MTGSVRAIDWAASGRSVSAVQVMGWVLTAIGAVGTVSGLFGAGGVFWLTPAALVLVAGLLMLGLSSLFTAWQAESRNQMYTICAAIVRDDESAS